MTRPPGRGQGRGAVGRWLRNIREPELLALLLGTDSLFLLLHLLHTIGWAWFAAPSFSVEHDGTFSESFQYVQTYWTAGMLLWLFLRMRQGVYLAWSSFYTYVLIDDWFTIHEQFGYKIAHHLHYAPRFRLRANDFGELTFFAAVGLLFLGLILAASVRSGPAVQAVSRRLGLLLLLFFSFGVVCDMIHMMVEDPTWRHVLVILEDGGELVAMSVICWYVFTLVRRFRRDRPPPPPGETRSGERREP